MSKEIERFNRIEEIYYAACQHAPDQLCSKTFFPGYGKRNLAHIGLEMRAS